MTARGALDAMLSVLTHRGPDDRGTYVEATAALGIRRLSIIDPEHGRQPMTNEDGSVVAVTNGEIYNFRDLQRELRSGGHRLVSDSDCEVIPHLYEEYGMDALQRLRGMFGLAIWDKRHRRLVVARDRLGIKPIYWYDDGRQVVFGSEIKAVLAHPDVPVALDYDSLALYLALRYVPSPRTLFTGINSLPPGCRLIVDARGARVERWWQLEFEATGTSGMEQATSELQALLRESVALHLQSDVPFGAFLSGGLDSSLVVALMAEVLDEPVRTYSVGFSAGGRSRGELSYARVVADALGTEHHELVMTGEDFIELAPRAISHLDQPIGDVAAVPMLALSSLAAQDVKMVLSGEGGDELYAGYARYVGERLGRALDVLPPTVRSRGVRLVRRHVRNPRLRLALQALAKSDPRQRMAAWFPLLDEELREMLFLGPLAAAAGATLPEDVFGGAFVNGGSDGLSRQLYSDITLWLPDDLLARGDKMAMAASLELRVPLLDHHVVEHAARLPSSLKLTMRERKAVLRNVARPLLPRTVLERPKEGFPVPLAEWIRGEARDFVGDLLAPSTLRRRGLFDPAGVTHLIDQHLTGLRDHSTPLWGLLALELWHREFLDRAPVAAAS